MSRDAFPYDPQDTRTASPRDDRSHRSFAPSDSRDRIDSGRNEGHPHQSADRREQQPAAAERSESPRAYYLRDRGYFLRVSEVHSLAEVGKFRVIAAPDLAKYAYGGDHARMEKDIHHLGRQGLLTDRTIEISQKKTLRILTLTKRGHRLLKGTAQLSNRQTVYHGLRKPREAKHDADLYRLYQKERARIERSGGRPLRIILDYELKKNLNRDLAFLGPEKDNLDRKAAIAEKHGLQVLNGKIPLPDLRLEYETPEGEVHHIDLELATRDYRPRGLAEKARAGFTLYSRPEDAGRLRRVLDEREITAGILSL
jgi:hypothetical protein